MQNYASLQETHEQEDDGGDGVIYHVAEPTTLRWNHIDDLDGFFTRMYKYHQKHGFTYILLQEILEHLQYIFIMYLTTMIFHGINYPVLFKDKLPAANSTKVTISDVLYPSNVVWASFGKLTYLFFIISTLVFMLKFLRAIYMIIQMWDIKQFYNTALQIPDSNIDNLTWHEVQNRIKAVQLEQQMCIHKRELTNLDIYHRILRQENYLVAMVNKKVLPPVLKMPWGEMVYWTNYLRLNIYWLFFWSPWSPFEHSWQLKEEYKKAHLRDELAGKFSKQVFYLTIVNTVMVPIIFLYQLLYSIFLYVDMLRRDPQILGMRRWSAYGQLYLRHFNELDHELQDRLTRAYRPAVKYVNAFNSPIVVLLAEHTAFICGAIVSVFVALTIYDEDVLTVEHVLTIMTPLGAFAAVSRSLIPKNSYVNPEPLLIEVLKHTHYLPPNWKGQSHTLKVRKEFDQLFEYKFMALILELFAPLVTPYILWFHIKPRSHDIIDFFRNFTVTVVGVGDVCSFAQLDVRKHGNPEWQSRSELDSVHEPTQYMQGEDGKVELSLMHFATTNPSWEPPPDAKDFVSTVPTQEDIIQTSLNPADYGSTKYRSMMLRSDLQPDNDLVNDPPDSMTFSAIFLHNRQHSQTRASTSAVETTPLLAGKSQSSRIS